MDTFLPHQNRKFMDSKHFWSLVVLFLSSWVFLGFSQSGDYGGSMQCIQKLLPCQPYLKSPSNPPASCCVPLEEMISDDSKCLCDVFNNPQILKSLNISLDDAQKLPKGCGTNADISVCKKAAAPITSPATPSSPADPSTGSSSSSTAKSSAYGISCVTGSCFIALFMALVISSFWDF